MLVKARVTEAVVGAIVTHVTNNVIFQLEFGGPYTLIAHVSRTICLKKVRHRLTSRASDSGLREASTQLNVLRR